MSVTPASAFAPGRWNGRWIWADVSGLPHGRRVVALRGRVVAPAGATSIPVRVDPADRTRVLIQRLVLMPGRAAAALEEHRQVIDAMIEGDAVRAEQLKRANIVSARRWFQDFKKFLR